MELKTGIQGINTFLGFSTNFSCVSIFSFDHRRVHYMFWSADNVCWCHVQINFVFFSLIIQLMTNGQFLGGLYSWQLWPVAKARFIDIYSSKIPCMRAADKLWWVSNCFIVCCVFVPLRVNPHVVSHWWLQCWRCLQVWSGFHPTPQQSLSKFAVQ